MNGGENEQRCKSGDFFLFVWFWFFFFLPLKNKPDHSGYFALYALQAGIFSRSRNLKVLFYQSSRGRHHQTAIIMHNGLQ